MQFFKEKASLIEVEFPLKFKMSFTRKLNGTGKLFE